MENIRTRGLTLTATEIFSESQEHGNLKRIAVRGSTIVLTRQILFQFLNTASMIIMARLLTPRDYGLVALVAPISGFIGLFGDLGLGSSAIQAKKITHVQLSTLFWVNTLAGILLMIFMCAISPLVGWFYHDKRVILITVLSSVGFIFNGLTVMHSAMMVRNMMFFSQAVLDVVSLFVSLLAAILSAWHGLGYWALLVQSLSQSFLRMVLTAACIRWKPGLPTICEGIGRHLRFGVSLQGFSIVNFIAMNLDNLLIGKFCGVEQLGLYSRAYNLVVMPLQQINAPISSVAVPALSRLQDSPEQYARFYLRALSIVALIAMPMFGLFWVLSDQIIRIVLGPTWMGAAIIFNFLAISGCIRPILSSLGWLFISSGNTHRMFKWGLINSIGVCLSICIGLNWGAVGVAFCYSISYWILILFSVPYAIKFNPLAIGNIVTCLVTPCIITFFGVLTSLMGKYFLLAHNYNALNVVIVCTLNMILAYIFILLLRKNDRIKYVDAIKSIM